ncbi:MAG: thioredoxin [Thiotrichaceae bacterium]
MINSPHIIAVTATNFTQEVIEKSSQVPVLVDFWAEWCAPCKMLMPILTKLAEEYHGQFILAKVNTDEQQELATQYGIRSIPTLKLFRRGRVVEDVAGVQSETVLRNLIDKHRDRPADKLRLQAEAHRFAGNNEQAIAILQSACALEPTYYDVHIDLIKLLIMSQQVEAAETILKDLPVNIQTEPRVQVLYQLLSFARMVENAPAQYDLEILLQSEPENLQARHQLAALQVLNENYSAALDHFLELMRRDRKFQEDAGRKGLLAVFNLLGNQGELVSRYRSQMTRLLY